MTTQQLLNHEGIWVGLPTYPKDWQESPLGDLVDINPETIGSGTPGDFFFRYIDLSSVDRGVTDWGTVQSMTLRTAPSRARRRVIEGDVLFGTVRPALQSHTFISAVDGSPLVASTGFAVLRAGAKSVPRFIKHLIFSAQVGAQVRRLETGSNYPAVNESDLRGVIVPQPDGHEQAHIAEVLDTLDAVIQGTKAGIAKQHNLGKGYLLDLLTRGIGEDGNLRDFSSQPEQFKDSPVGRIPRSWATLSLAELTSTIVDGVHHTPTYVESGVPFLTVENLTRGNGISYSPCRYVTEKAHLNYCSRAHPEVGDVLVSKDGTLGVARVVPPGVPEFSIFVSIALLRARVELMKAELISEFFNTPWFERQLGWLSAGTGLKHIHLEHFRAFLLPVPPLPEQHYIVQRLTAFHESQRREEFVLARLEALKAGLSSDLFTGRVRTRQQ